MREIKPGYFLITEYGDYAVIERETNDYQPFVVANGLQKDGTWNFGHYFCDLFDAVDYAKSQADERHI